MTEDLYTKSKALGLDYLKDRTEKSIYSVPLSTYEFFDEKFTYNDKEKFMNACEKLFKSFQDAALDFYDHESVPEDMEANDEDLHKLYDYILLNESPDVCCHYPVYLYFMKYETEDEFISKKEKQKQANALAVKKREEAKAKRELKKQNPAKALVDGLTPEMKEALRKELG